MLKDGHCFLLDSMFLIQKFNAPTYINIEDQTIQSTIPICNILEFRFDYLEKNSGKSHDLQKYWLKIDFL